MATRAIALDRARGWTAVPMTSTGCYDTNHIFYAFQVCIQNTRGTSNTPKGVLLVRPSDTPIENFLGASFDTFCNCLCWHKGVAL